VAREFRWREVNAQLQRLLQASSSSSRQRGRSCLQRNLSSCARPSAKAVVHTAEQTCAISSGSCSSTSQPTAPPSKASGTWRQKPCPFFRPPARYSYSWINLGTNTLLPPRHCLRPPHSYRFHRRVKSGSSIHRHTVAISRILALLASCPASTRYPPHYELSSFCERIRSLHILPYPDIARIREDRTGHFCAQAAAK